MPTLKEWAVVGTPPSIRLQGVVAGHHRKEDGKRVTTTPVVRVEGRTITTRSGTVYTLEGPPEPGYLKWLADNNYLYDDADPIGKGRNSRKAVWPQ